MFKKGNFKFQPLKKKEDFFAVSVEENLAKMKIIY